MDRWVSGNGRWVDASVHTEHAGELGHGEEGGSGVEEVDVKEGEEGHD